LLAKGVEIKALDLNGGEIWVVLWFKTAHRCITSFVEYASVFITNAEIG